MKLKYILPFMALLLVGCGEDKTSSVTQSTVPESSVAESSVVPEISSSEEISVNPNEVTISIAANDGIMTSWFTVSNNFVFALDLGNTEKISNNNGKLHFDKEGTLAFSFEKEIESISFSYQADSESNDVTSYVGIINDFGLTAFYEANRENGIITYTFKNNAASDHISIQPNLEINISTITLITR